MSKILYFSENLDKIVDHVTRFEAEIEAAKPIFDIKGKRIEECSHTTPKHSAHYRSIAAELRALDELLELKKNAVEGACWKRYNEDHRRALNTRDIQAYIQHEPQVLEYAEIQLVIKHLRYQVDAIVEALQALHWQLNNITKLRVAELQDDVL